METKEKFLQELSSNLLRRFTINQEQATLISIWILNCKPLLDVNCGEEWNDGYRSYCEELEENLLK